MINHQNSLPTIHWPDHLDLPYEDGRIKDFFESPQAMLLSQSIRPILHQCHSDNQFAIGHDSGIYWRYVPENPLLGCVAPGWFYIPNVPRMKIDGRIRHSYVMWQELIAPHIVIEFARTDGTAARDQTPHKGKFWIYEKVIRPVYYGILEFETHQFELFRFDGVRFQTVKKDRWGNYPLETLNVALGFSQQTILNVPYQWLCWFDSNGMPLSTPNNTEERQLTQNTEKLRQKLRALGIDPDAL